jgi:hypothetical protein
MQAARAKDNVSVSTLSFNKPQLPESAQTVCAVCMEAPRSVVLLPCRHLMLCKVCSDKMQQDSAIKAASGCDSMGALCPICRAPVKHFMTVYM